MEQNKRVLLVFLLVAFVVVQGQVFAPKALAQTGKQVETLTGTLRYASMSFWVETGKGRTVDLMYDMDDASLDSKLMKLNGQKVTLNGKYVTYPDKSRFFEVASIGGKAPTGFTVAGGSVRFNGKTVFSDDESFSVRLKKTYTFAGNPVALVEVGSGGAACPAEYVFVTVGANGAANVSNLFGNCSDIPKISQQGEKITLAFPGNPPEVWTYANGKVVKKK